MDSSNSSDEEGLYSISDVREAMNALFIVVRSQGHIVADRNIDSVAADRALIRRTAAICLLDLIKLKTVGKTLSVHEWHSLGWTLLDTELSSRKAILSKLCTIIQTHNVHPRFLAYTCLMASDEHLAEKAATSLEFAVRRLRKTSELLLAKAATTKTSTEEADRLRSLATSHMPECVVPYVLHLVSHHPDFPSADELKQGYDLAPGEDRKRLRAVVRSVTMIIDKLLLSAVSSTTSGSRNLSYLMKQADLISQFYVDRLDAGNKGLVFVAQLARKILRDRAKTSDEPCPHDIPLPMDIYMSIEEIDVPATRLGVSNDDLDQQERVLDRMLVAVGRASPKKAWNRAVTEHKRKLSPKGKARVKPSVKDEGNSDEEMSSHGSDGETEKATTVDHKAERKKESKKIVEHKKTKQQQSRAKPKAVSVPVKPVREGTRSMPVRGSRAAVVSYAEKDENEAEVEAWEQQARENESKRSTGDRSLTRPSKSVIDSVSDKNTSSDIEASGTPDEEDVFAFSPTVLEKRPSSASSGKSSTERIIQREGMLLVRVNTGVTSSSPSESASLSQTTTPSLPPPHVNTTRLLQRRKSQGISVASSRISGASSVQSLVALSPTPSDQRYTRSSRQVTGQNERDFFTESATSIIRKKRPSLELEPQDIEMSKENEKNIDMKNKKKKSFGRVIH